MKSNFVLNEVIESDLLNTDLHLYEKDIIKHNFFKLKN